MVTVLCKAPFGFEEFAALVPVPFWQIILHAHTQTHSDEAMSLRWGELASDPVNKSMSLIASHCE